MISLNAQIRKEGLRVTVRKPMSESKELGDCGGSKIRAVSSTQGFFQPPSDTSQSRWCPLNIAVKQSPVRTRALTLKERIDEHLAASGNAFAGKVHLYMRHVGGQSRRPRLGLVTIAQLTGHYQEAFENVHCARRETIGDARRVCGPGVRIPPVVRQQDNEEVWNTHHSSPCCITRFFHPERYLDGAMP